MKQQLVEIDARLALDDGHDSLVVLDRRETLHLKLVNVVDEDAALLRFSEELVHRPGARAALVRDVEPLDHATGADRLEDRVWSGERFAGIVRRRSRGPGAGGRAADRLRVLRL